jgi:hypothetical protein
MTVKKAFVHPWICITYFKYTFHGKIQLFMTLKSDHEPDPHWFGSLDPVPHWNLLESTTLEQMWLNVQLHSKRTDEKLVELGVLLARIFWGQSQTSDRVLAREYWMTYRELSLLLSCRWSSILTGRRGGGGGERGTKSHDREKAWPSLNHSTLSGPTGDDWKGK